jgi:hypothetical protein
MEDSQPISISEKNKIKTLLLDTQPEETEEDLSQRLFTEDTPRSEEFRLY